jgi:hypothetical protein
VNGSISLLQDLRQKRLFSATIGGGATVKSSDKWRVRSFEIILERTKAFLAKAQSSGRRKERKEVLLCVSSRLGVFARACLFFHGF